MHDVNGWLMALAFVIGLLLTFAFMIRRVRREVPIYAAAGGTAAPKSTGGKTPETKEEPYGSGSLRLAAGAGAPSGYAIKGNEDSMLFHTPDSPSYEQTIAEVWFRDEETAEKAGFTRWDKNKE